MQGQGMTGERRPVCEGRTHWRGGDKVTDDGSHETPRTGRGGGRTQGLFGGGIARARRPGDGMGIASLLVDLGKSDAVGLPGDEFHLVIG